MRRSLIATLAILTIAAPALARDRDEVPAATPTGAPQSCIPIVQIRETRVRNNKVIDFVTFGRRGYRNVLPSDCPSLGAERRFLYETSLSQLCSTDIITVLYDAPALTRGASCGLGQFQPIELERR